VRAPADARVTVVDLPDRSLPTEASPGGCSRGRVWFRSFWSRPCRELLGHIGSNGGLRLLLHASDPSSSLSIGPLALDAAANVYSSAGTRRPQIVRVTAAGRVTSARS
jgi:hypothetical protein